MVGLVSHHKQLRIQNNREWLARSEQLNQNANIAHDLDMPALLWEIYKPFTDITTLTKQNNIQRLHDSIEDTDKKHQRAGTKLKKKKKATGLAGFTTDAAITGCEAIEE